MVAALAAAALAGCGGGIFIGDFDCDDEIAHAKRVHGEPDRVDRHVVESGVHVETFWFVTSGLGITFIWGGDVGCERRDFHA